MDNNELIALGIIALIENQCSDRTAIERMLKARGLASKVRYADQESREQVGTTTMRKELPILAYGGSALLETTYAIMPGGMVSWTVPDNKSGELIEIQLDASIYTNQQTKFWIMLAVQDATDGKTLITDFAPYRMTTFSFGNLKLNAGDQISVAARTTDATNPGTAYATIIGKEIG